MKLGLTGTTRRSETALTDAAAQAQAHAQAHAKAQAASAAVRVVRRGRERGSRLPSDDRSMVTTSPTSVASAAPRKERNALETKRRILEAAETEFAAKGFDGARLGTIARAASVQQALIHHYFGDKEGLHGEVVRSGLASMTEAVWQLLSRMDAPPGKPAAKAVAAKKTPGKNGAKNGATPRAGAKATANATAKTTLDDLRTLAEAFVELLLKFFATNGSFLAILRHEAGRDGAGAAKIVHGSVGPVFDGIVARLDAMRARGDVRKDLDTKHLVISCVAMVAFPFQEEPFVKAIWPADWHSEAFLEERRKHIVAMILARVAPSPADA